jgi:MYXO-CTERM domain-containing protein
MTPHKFLNPIRASLLILTLATVSLGASVTAQTDTTDRTTTTPNVTTEVRDDGFDLGWLGLLGLAGLLGLRRPTRVVDRTGGVTTTTR